MLMDMQRSTWTRRWSNMPVRLPLQCVCCRQEHSEADMRCRPLRQATRILQMDAQDGTDSLFVRDCGTFGGWISFLQDGRE
jgi:hypothetical protein